MLNTKLLYKILGYEVAYLFEKFVKMDNLEI